MLFWFLSFPICLLSLAVRAWSSSLQPPTIPASIPLAVRSPYLSGWHSSPQTSQSLSCTWPELWDTSSTLGWVGRVRVDNVTYEWMGADVDPPFIVNITNVRMTPTRSMFSVQAGPMSLTVTFLSPIEPSDWVHQSLPFSYVFIDASAADGQAHDVQVYVDITAKWLSEDRQRGIKRCQSNPGCGTHPETELQSPEVVVESAKQRALDVPVYLAIAHRPDLTLQTGISIPSSQLDTHENSTNTFSTPFPPIQYRTKSVTFALAVDLGRMQNIQEPVVWAIGFSRGPSITYTSPESTVQQLSPYFVMKYGPESMGVAIDDFIANFNDTLARAVAFDNATIADATAISPYYAGLVSLAVQQTMSSLDITVSTGSDKKPNASDVRIFMKDVGFGATTLSRVNPVERMYVAMPALLYVNASLLGPMLSPLLEAQDGANATPYAAQDLGLAYPNATGTRGPHDRGVEQCGNMLLMLYAHARFSGDGSLLWKHYGLAKRWADYLVNYTLATADKLSSDNEGAKNMTNVGLKGIIGVRAMAEISRALGGKSDARWYNDSARDLAEQWHTLALSADKHHLLGTYGAQESWALMYNLYADRLLGTNIVSQAILQGQTAFYKNLLSTAPAFGLALDSTSTETSAGDKAWLLFTAAVMQDKTVHDALVDSVWNRVSNATTGVFPDRYDVNTGTALGGSAVPVVGGILSLLALNLPAKEIVVPPARGGSTRTTPRRTVFVNPMFYLGGVVGGLAAVALMAMAVHYFPSLRPPRGENIPEDEVALLGSSSDWPYVNSPADAHSNSHGTEEARSAPIQANTSSSLGKLLHL